MVINEIFKSIDGEARRAGEVATFVRTSGCPLRCSYCDSKYTWEAEPTCKNMTVEEIVEQCKSLGAFNITFTGGEPLCQKDSDELINRLAEEGFDVSIETCGAIDFSERDWFKERLENVWVCADYKCKSSEMSHKMLPVETFSKLRNHDVIKFVVGSKEDLDQAKEVYDYLRKSHCECWVYFSPVFGTISYEDIVNYIIENNMQHKVRFQLQLHKFVWDPDKRGV